MTWINEYGLFLAKVVTIVVAIGVIVIFVLGQSLRRQSRQGELELQDLGEQYRDIQKQMQLARRSEATRKLWLKQQKKQQKQQQKVQKQRAKNKEEEEGKPCLYILDFKGSIDAHEVTSLREEITAILSIIQPQDEVLLRLESPGGVVHGYGLASSQLERLRRRDIKLTIAVDKVAASGGYMMACVAQHIIAAPFAIIGSIGVVAQLPNFHRFLQKNNIDIELHTAGQYKRTLTLFGENTEQGRLKFQQELEQTHQLFKRFIHEQRPALDLESVSTGEHWFGWQAIDLGLIDEIGTSDDLLLSLVEERDLILVRYTHRKPLVEKLVSSFTGAIEHRLLRWWQKGQRPTL
ncbi:MAG: protease SohB [Enterobacteriaceae bacterium]